MVRNWQIFNIAIATNELEDQFEILQAKLDITVVPQVGVVLWSSKQPWLAS